MQKDQMEQQSSSSDQSIMLPIDMLPNELQHKILFHLPTDDAVRCKAVCKDWDMAIKSLALGTLAAYTPRPQEPFYFMFNYPDSKGTYAYAYNTDKRKWVPFENLNYDQVQSASSADRFRPMEYYLEFSASGGLVCFMDQLSPDNICVCNPILNNRVRILPYWRSCAPSSDFSTMSCAFALSTDIHSRRYVVAMIKSYAGDPLLISYKTTIQLYESKIHSWINLHTEDTSWLVHGSCVICQDVLYSVALIHQFSEPTQPHHGVVAYNLLQRKQKQSLLDTMVVVPCAILCVKLLNLNDKLILVGGIVNAPNKMEDNTIGIWEMCGNGWKEITRAPSDVIRHFQDDAPVPSRSFMSSGYGNLVFFQGYTSSDLLIYELHNNVWKFVPKPPFASSNGRQQNYFGGFCLEPRLDIVP